MIRLIRRLNKLNLQTKKNWSELLKSAVLSMNSIKKKSHGYTPYKVKFGRESRYEDLLSTINDTIPTPQEDLELGENTFAEFQLTEDELREQGFEEISFIDHKKAKIYKCAANSIRSNQLRQKRQFDKKVNETRCVLLNIGNLRVYMARGYSGVLFVLLQNIYIN